jgi:hypothetical protein
MNNKEIQMVEREANKQGLQLSDLFLLKEIDDIENQADQSDDLNGLDFINLR